MSTLYTIGYQGQTPDTIGRVMRALDAKLIDIRSRPTSRVPGFGGRQLAARFGGLYAYAGDSLGGLPASAQAARATPPTEWPRGMDFLRGYYSTAIRSAIVMCQERAPGDCHRHGVALEALRHGIVDRAVHVYYDGTEWERIEAQALAACLADPNPNAEYECDVLDL